MQCLLYLSAHFELFYYSHEPRSRFKLDLPQVRLVKTEKGPMIMSSKLFNKLPLEIKLLGDKGRLQD